MLILASQLSAVFLNMLLRFCDFSLVILVFSPYVSMLSKVTPKILILVFVGIGMLSISSFGSNFTSFDQVENQYSKPSHKKKQRELGP